MKIGLRTKATVPVTAGGRGGGDKKHKRPKDTGKLVLLLLALVEVTT